MLRSLAAVLIALALTSCGGSDSAAEGDAEQASSPEPASLEDPYDTCANFLESDVDDQFGSNAPDVEDVFALEDDDTRIVVSPPEGENVQPLIYQAVECALVGLDAPDYVKDDVLKTPATDGPQTKSWDDVTIEYDIPGPDFAGLSATIERTPDAD